MKEINETNAIDYSIYVLNNAEKKKYYFLSLTGLFLLGYLFYHNLFLSSMFMLAAFPGEKKYAENLALKRRNDLSIQFRDLLYSFSSSVSAGRQISESLEEAKNVLLSNYGENSLLYREVEWMTRVMKETNESEENLLNDFARRSHVEEIRQFVRVCEICKRTGGDLDHVIGKTVSILMAKIELERDIQAITAQKRLESKILTAIPIIMVCFLNIFSPEYLSVLYETSLGRGIMTLAFIGIGISYYISKRIMEICL